MKDPAFLFYSSDFLTGVADLTMEERGQYITLLCLQHQKGPLTEKVVSIAVASVSDDVLAKFKKDQQGNFYNERLKIEAEKRAKHSEKQSLRAKEGWKKRKSGQSPNNAAASAMAMPLENVNVNEDRDVNRDVDKGENKKNRFSFKSRLLELGAKEAHVEDWLKARRQKKAANTETALKGFLAEVKKAKKSVAEIVELCAIKEWKGFEAKWLIEQNQKSSAQKERREPSQTAKFMAAGRDNYETLVWEIQKELDEKAEAARRKVYGEQDQNKTIDITHE